MPIKLDLWDYNRFKKSIPHPSNYPIITNVEMSDTGNVVWDTDVASTSQVQYGLNPLLGQISEYDSTLETHHSLILDLIPNNYYYFKVQSFRIDALSISVLYVKFIPALGFPALKLRSPDLTIWGLTVTTDGNLSTNVNPPYPTGSAEAYDPNFVFRDSSNVYWELSIDNTGHLVTTSGGTPDGAYDEFQIYDSNGRTWNLTVSTSGNLTTT